MQFPSYHVLTVYYYAYLIIITYLSHYRDLLKAIIVLLPLLGLTWIIGIFAVNNETRVFAWIFAILNSFQVSKNRSLKYTS